MLYEFIVAHRDKIIERARKRVQGRSTSKSIEAKLVNGIPLFLSQLAEAMIPSPTEALRIVGAEDSSKKIGDTAALHGHELLRNGFTVAQVVHGYGDVCQIVTELATEADAEISAHDFHVFNRCLDDAIAGAVTAYGDQRERDLAYEGTERLGVLAHELRNLLHNAVLSFDAIKKGMVGIGGSTGAIHSRSLAGIRALVEQSLAEVRLEAGVPKMAHLSVAEFIEEIELSAAMQAEGLGLSLTVNTVPSEVIVDADRQLLASAVLNLLQNAFKFSRPRGCITLTARTEANRVLIEVFDECGGLPPGKAEALFRPFVRGSADHSGLGLGLSIARSAARANSGELYVRDIPGTGCVFTIELPRQPPPPTSIFQTKPPGASQTGSAGASEAQRQARA